MKSALHHLWDVYSKPRPAGREVPTLLCLCAIIAVVTGVFLRYGPGASDTAAGVCGAVVFLLTFLFHPLRCVLTMTLPTLCTKQGRRLVISTSMMVLLLNVTPNITLNMGALLNILKCTSEGLVQTLLNSTELFNGAQRDLIKETQKKIREGVWFDWFGLNVETHLTEFNHSTHIDVSEVTGQFSNISRQIESQFSHTKNLLKECKRFSSTILSAIFLVYLIVESARYLQCYLTSVTFDNVYLSGELTQTASKNDVTGTKNKVNYACFKITKQEFSKCLASLLVVSLYFTAALFAIASDHIVYYLVTLIQPQLMEDPSISASLNVTYKVQSIPKFCWTPLCPVTDLISNTTSYDLTFRLSLLCDAQFSAPDVGLRVLLGFLYLLCYVMVFLEIYARRARRAVSAAFYREQEEKRRDFLLKKMQIKQARNENKDIFTITIAQGSAGPVTSDQF